MEPLDRVLGLADEPAHDYPHGPPTRWVRPWSSWLVTGLTAAGALLVGFLLVAGLSAGRTSAREQDARKDELIELINAREAHAEQLTARLDGLRNRVTAVEAGVAAGRPSLAAELRVVEEAAGLTRVTGPGVRVSLSDGPDECSAESEECRIQDSDLQQTVNALFGAGAEAVAINGERVIATTAIRRAGRSLLVNYRVLNPPYVIEAIGNPDRLLLDFSRSDIAQQFAVWTEVYGLGFVSEISHELDVPAYGGSVQLRTAEVEGATEIGGDGDPGEDRTP